MKTLCALALACLVALPAFAQAPAAPPANPITASVGGQLAMVKGNIVKSAEQVPESLYGFKATPEVRSFGQLFGHVADANYAICAVAAASVRSACRMSGRRRINSDGTCKGSSAGSLKSASVNRGMSVADGV